MDDLLNQTLDYIQLLITYAKPYWKEQQEI